jgi:hypothetical protein
MKRVALLLVAVAMGVGLLASMPRTAGPRTSAGSNEQTAPVFLTKVPRGYRDWKLVSVAHEAGELNDIRAILGNDIAIKTYRDGTLPFPDGAIIARIAWNYVPSEENDKVFGHPQSFVAGSTPTWGLQFMVKDSKKYAATGGWGFGQFGKDGKPNLPEAVFKKCFPCHIPAKDRDYLFTHYSP